MRIIICALLGLISTFNFAQEGFFTPLAEEDFCRPGVTNKSPSKGIVLEYGIQPNYSINTSVSQDGSSKISRNERFRFKFKIPVIHKKNFKFLLGADHQRERYHFDFIDAEDTGWFDDFNGKTLKATRLSAYFLKSLNDKWYATVKVEGSYNGDYNKLVSFKKRYATYRGIAMAGFKKRADLEMGFGLMYSSGFRRTIVLPFALYNQTFNDKWGLEAVLPVKIRMRYNLTPRSVLLFGPEYVSRTYSIDLKESGNTTSLYHLRRSEVQLALNYRQQISSWLWADVKGGYSHPFTTRFERKSTEPLGLAKAIDGITAQASGGAFIRFGLFISPPKNLMK